MLLRSIKAQVTRSEALSISVVYHYDNTEFHQGYLKIQAKHPDIHYHLQQGSSLKNQLLELIDRETKQFFSFFVDDLVVIRPFSITDHEFSVLATRSDIAALSLRLNPAVDFSQPLNRQIRPPKLSSDNTWVWNVRASRLSRLWKRPVLGDWSLALNLDGNVYRYDDIKAYFRTLPEIPHVTALEGIMSTRPLPGKRILCYSHSRIINLAMNRVDTHSVFPCGEESAVEFNERFLKGEVLSFEHFRSLAHRACHIVTKPEWVSVGCELRHSDSSAGRRKGIS